MPHTNVTYKGTALPADSTTVSIFDTSTFSSKRFISNGNYDRLLVDVKNSHTATYKWYKSSDRGTNWNQIGESAVSVPAATASNVTDFLITGYDDFKLEWVNGGTTQTTFEIDISLGESDRSVGV